MSSSFKCRRLSLIRLPLWAEGLGGFSLIRKHLFRFGPAAQNLIPDDHMASTFFRLAFGTFIPFTSHPSLSLYSYLGVQDIIPDRVSEEIRGSGRYRQGSTVGTETHRRKSSGIDRNCQGANQLSPCIIPLHRDSSNLTTGTIKRTSTFKSRKGA